MKLILTSTRDIAKVIECTPQEVQHKAKEGIWTFVRVIPPKKGKVQNRYEAVAADLAKYLGITIEEVERKLNDGRN